MSRLLRDWGPAITWAVLIFIVSSRSTVPIHMENGLDKVFHFAAYTVFGAALSWGGARRAMPALAVAAIGIAYGGSDELHQFFVPGRSADVLDWFADSAGIVTGVALCFPLFTRLVRGPRSRMP